MIKVHIQKPWVSGFDTAKIIVISDNHNERAVITVSEGGKLTGTLLTEPGTQLPPFLEMPEDFFNDFVKAILGYAEDNGIKLESQSVIQGKFEAQSLHLEDMRELLLGKSKINIERKP